MPQRNVKESPLPIFFQLGPRQPGFARDPIFLKFPPIPKMNEVDRQSCLDRTRHRPPHADDQAEENRIGSSAGPDLLTAGNCSGLRRRSRAGENPRDARTPGTPRARESQGRSDARAVGGGGGDPEQLSLPDRPAPGRTADRGRAALQSVRSATRARRAAALGRSQSAQDPERNRISERKPTSRGPWFQIEWRCRSQWPALPKSDLRWTRRYWIRVKDRRSAIAFAKRKTSRCRIFDYRVKP